MNKKNSLVKVKVIEKHPLLFSFLVISALTFIAYGGSIWNGFVWDDETFIVHNPYVNDISRWAQYFTKTDSISSISGLDRMYRPIQTLSFSFDVLLWGKWAGGVHLTSLILHIASCLAILFSFKKIIDIKFTTLAAFVFAIHPALSEATLSLAGRGNQLYTLFALISLGTFLRINKTFDLNHIISITAFALALFSKEPAIALMAILPLVQIIFKLPWNLNSKKSLLLYAPFLTATILFLLARGSVVDTSSAVDYWGGSLYTTILMQAKVFSIYLYLLIWPFNLKGRYVIESPLYFLDPIVIGAIILNAALLIFAVVAYRHGTKGKLISTAIAWFYISLAPVSNIIPIPGSMMGERFIYFTFAGMIPLLAGIFQNVKLERSKSAALLLCAVVSIAWISKDILRTSDWKDNSKFFKVLSKQTPNSFIIQIRLAQAELETNNISSALNRLEKLTANANLITNPENKAALHYWYGRALLSSNRQTEAYKELTLAIALKPKSYKDIMLLFAEAAARSGDLNKAQMLLENEIKLNPHNDALWNGLGNISLMKGDISAAIAYYRRALEVNPQNTEAAINLQNASSMKKELPLARQ